MQVNRLFEIIYILLEKNSVTAKELAEKFEVSQRTIYRDIEILSTAGIPVYMSKGKGGGISILPDFILNKAILTEDEKPGILSAIRAVDAVSFNDSEPKKVLRKLNNILGENDTDWIEVDFSNWGNTEREKETFNNLKSAILSKKVVNFDYSSGKGENISREVCPLKLYFKGQSWYMYGYCKIRNDYRFFKLRMIKDLYISEEGFNIKAPKNIMKEDNVFNNELITLKMRISSKMAYRVYDEFEDFKKLDDGNFIVTIEYPKGEWLFSYISSFGQECEVLAPQEMREEIKNKVNEYAIGLYSDYQDSKYLVTVGNEVCKAENEGLTIKKIPAGKYAKFSIEGHMEKAVAQAWNEIWKMDLDRSYKADFEEYLNSYFNNSKIDIYISLK